MDLEVRAYEDSYREQWEDFIDNSANGTFLHRRSFMEYHGYRFEDASVMVWKGGDILAVLPAHRVGDQVFSHQGLSFGGWIFKKGLEKSLQKEIIKQSLDYFKDRNVNSIAVTSVPVFYHQESVSDQDYLLDLGFSIENKKHTAVITLPKEIKDRGKRWGIKKAKSLGVSIQEKVPDAYFWNEILLPHHLQKLGSPPVHTQQEIHQLYKNHPNQISLFQASIGDEILAGLILFKHTKVIKIQYSTLTEKGKAFRAMDFLIQVLMDKSKVDFLDMGTSIDPWTGKDNVSLVKWKESFGAKPVSVPTYHINLED